MKCMYMFALIPARELMDELEGIRQGFANKYKCKAALRNPIHITLIPPFHADEDNEQQLMKALVPFAANNKGFAINLKGYGSFPKNKVVFIKAIADRRLKQFHADMMKAFKEHLPDINLITFDKFSPHITLGYRDLTPEYFEAALQDLQNKVYENYWQVDGFQLWKRTENQWINIHAYNLI